MHLKTPRERWVQAAKQAAADPLPVIEVGIPMRDGIELAADVYLPVETDRPAPAIVTMTPYDKTPRFPEIDEAGFYQRHGYAFVVVDCRGRGKSEGVWRAFVNDGPDGHDVVEWVARQPWCHGKVGTTGLSYMGWTQWATAAELPPHLTCMVSTSAAGRWQREIPYTDGCFQLYFGWWVYMVRRRITERYGISQHDWDEILRRLPLEAIGSFVDPAGETWRDLMDHDTLDEHWLALRYDDRYARIDVPCLHVTGWFDLEDLTGAFHHYEGMVAASPARERQRLLVGPWSHGNSRRPHSSYTGIEFGPDAAVEMDDVHLRWFDHWLKGSDNGVPNDPPVSLFETGTNVWRDGERWSRATREESLFLRYDGVRGTLSPGPADGVEPTRSYRYDPLDPAPTQIDVKNYAIEEVPLDQTAVEARPDVIAYTSEPLTEEFVVSGWPHLELFAGSDCDDTDWHVKLTDVLPDGRSLKVCQGCRRASYRASLTDPTPLTPGEVHRFDVELWPVHHAFLPGHRIRLTITSSDFPWFARNLNRFGPLKFQADPRVATNTVHHSGAQASRMILPVERGILPGDERASDEPIAFP
jgi:putative CocE/NonD family hydrolase